MVSFALGFPALLLNKKHGLSTEKIFIPKDLWLLAMFLFLNRRVSNAAYLSAQSA
jgi:hypothetical protein